MASPLSIRNRLVPQSEQTAAQRHMVVSGEKQPQEVPKQRRRIFQQRLVVNASTTVPVLRIES
jgi:hypothetical protein